ncbi:sodium-dependent glucose transporter 1A-like isoform X2 [Oppia nitens]|nr:sodium-dependent glucose transporter 1A-like isoform X2 [Oppia nitens]
MDRVSLIFVLQSAGILTGSLFGLLFKHVNRQLVLTGLLVLMSLSTLLIPFSQRLWHLYYYNYAFGVASGAWLNIKNVWTIELWNHRSAAPLQLSSLMYGLGTVLGPLIADPYLTGHNNNNTITTTIITTNGTLVVVDVEEDRLHKIRSPFVICAIIELIGPILLIIMYFLRKYEKTDDNYEEIDDQRDIDRKASVTGIRHLRPALIALVAVFLAFHMSSEQITQQFGATYFQDIPLKLTASQSAELVSAMAVADTVGLAVSVFIANIVSPHYMLSYHLFIIFVALNILFLNESAQWLLYAGSLSLAYGYSAVYPSVFALISRYIDVTDSVCTIFIISSVLLNLFMPLIIGLYIEHYVHVLMMSVSFNLAISIIVFIFTIQLINKYCKY